MTHAPSDPCPLVQACPHPYGSYTLTYCQPSLERLMVNVYVCGGGEGVCVCVELQCFRFDEMKICSTQTVLVIALACFLGRIYFNE